MTQGPLTLHGALDKIPMHVDKLLMKNDPASESKSEPENEFFDNLMSSMDPLDPPPHDPPTRKRPLWLRDTLQDD